MNMKALCGYLFASIGLIGLTPPLVAAESVAKKPNVILIFSDDQRADTIHALGNDTIRTPNLDRLVRAGTSFSNAYMMGAMTGATCVPSRAQLLSGRSVFRLQGIGRVIALERGHAINHHHTFSIHLHDIGRYAFGEPQVYLGGRTYLRQLTDLPTNGARVSCPTYPVAGSTGGGPGIVPHDLGVRVADVIAIGVVPHTAVTVDQYISRNALLF